MFRTLEDSGPPMSKEDLETLERKLQCGLPPDYAAFLLHYNGGAPTPDTVPIQDWPNGGPEADVRWLYYYGSDPSDVYDLRWCIDTLAGRMPRGLLPIAGTSCGDEFCLWLTGDRRGEVVLWDHEAEHHPPTEANLHRVAPSFTAFLELLRDPSED